MRISGKRYTNEFSMSVLSNYLQVAYEAMPLRNFQVLGFYLNTNASCTVSNLYVPYSAVTYFLHLYKATTRHIMMNASIITALIDEYMTAS